MKYARILGLGLMVLALTVTGCGNQPTSTPPTVKKDGDKKDTVKKEGDKKDEHAHGNGPAGGVTFDMGKYHAELRVSHKDKTMGIAFISEVKGKPEKDWPLLPVDAKEFTITTKETKTKEGTVVKPMTIALKPKDAKDGKAAEFVGTDPGVGNVADFEGTVLGEIDGKPSQGEFKE
jgi:predicted small lipoprotein YifL